MSMKSLALVLGVLAAGPTLAAPVPLTQVGNLTCTYEQCGSRIAVSGSYLYTPASCGAAGACLKVYDLQAPTAPAQVGSVPFITGSDVIAAGRYLYLPSSGGLQIADLRNPTAPALVGQASFNGGFRAALSGNYLYVAAVSYSYGAAGLQVVDVTDPAAPAAVGFLGMAASARGIGISGTIAYVVDDAGTLHVVDVSSPTAPREITQLDLGEPAYDLALSGTYGYAVTHSVYCDDEACTLSQGHLKVLDLGVPTAPRVVSSIRSAQGSRGDRPLRPICLPHRALDQLLQQRWRADGRRRRQPLRPGRRRLRRQPLRGHRRRGHGELRVRGVALEPARLQRLRVERPAGLLLSRGSR